MSATPRKLLVADLFCGAGGSSTGAQRALRRLGFEMDLLCVNHWPLAIETHRRNHPEARHYCQDVATLRPHLAVPGGRLDLLMASPTCTHHSRARGGKPVSDQQRMDPWHVVTWLTELRVKCLIVENVPEFIEWGPVDARTGRPIKSRKGEYFRAWCAAIEAVGMRLAWRVLNAADYGDATTRQRFFLLARSDRRPIAWPASSHAADTLDLGKERWRAAREIIDWSIAGRSIFHRKRPLSPKTLARIHAGAVKFRWPEPFLVVLRQHMAARGLDLPLPTVTTSSGYHFALVQPFVLGQHAGNAPRGADEPLPTIPGAGAHALIAPYYGSGSGATCGSAEEPLPTVTTRDRFGLVVPITHAPAAGCGDGRARSCEDPLPTVTGANRGELAFVAPHLAAGCDILYRMLQPHELAAAMGFTSAESSYAFAGTKTEVIKQIGNAVPVNTAAALVTASVTT